MATIIFTEGAKGLAREQMALLPDIAVVMIQWANETKDNVRGTDGEVVWKSVETPHWTVDVGSWTKVQEVEIRKYAIRVDDLYVMVDPKVTSANGKLVVDAVDGKFCVEHHAI
jgi:hypothetical protein